MKLEERINVGSDSSMWEVLSIKERVAAANYALKVTGICPEDEDVSDIIGEVYAG